VALGQVGAIIAQPKFVAAGNLLENLFVEKCSSKCNICDENSKSSILGKCCRRKIENV